MNHDNSPPLPWPDRQPDAHKGNFGRVMLVGGSRGMAGSISLSAIAALHTGSGLVTAAVPDRCLETVAGYHPSIMTLPLADTAEGHFAVGCRLPDPTSFDCIGCGPGMRTRDGSIELVECLLHRSSLMRVFDADALNILAQQDLLQSPALPRDQSRLVLTPHPGELARLTGVSPRQRESQIDAAEALANEFGVTIVVKGGPTVVVGKSHDGSPARYTNATGNPGMASAGTGDVLAGIITSLAGQGLDGWDAARLGVFIHGLAGDIAAERFSQPAMTSFELLQCLPDAIGRIT